MKKPKSFSFFIWIVFSCLLIGPAIAYKIISSQEVSVEGHAKNYSFKLRMEELRK